MSTAYADLTAALIGQLKAMTGLPAVAYPNRDFEPPSDAMWLRFSLLPANVQVVELGDGAPNWTSGIAQVSVFAPLNSGHGEALAMVDKVLSQFKRGAVCSHGGLDVRIRRSWPGPMIFEEAWLHVPVSVEYLALTEN